MPKTTYRDAVLLRAHDARVGGTALSRDPALHRVRRGVYVDGAVWRALAPWDRYRVRVEAVAATWDRPVFALESAASLSGLPVFGEPRDIHLVAPDGRSRRFGDVRLHRASDARTTISTASGACTSVADTAIDLCRVLPPAFALATANAALRSLLPHGDTIDFAEAGRRQTARRGRRLLDWVQARASAVPESVGESVSLAVIEWLGFEAPECQVEFAHEGARDRTDFFWRSQRIVGESDGYGKYDADDPAAMKAHFVSEKQREDRLRRYVAGFARWDWTDAMRADTLALKLRNAGLVPVRPRATALLATLDTHPRSFPSAPTARRRAAETHVSC